MSNLFRVGMYRLGLKSGLHPVLKLKRSTVEGPLFRQSERDVPAGAMARSSWKTGQAMYFGQMVDGIDEPVDWHANPFQPNARIKPDRPWWKISDFNLEIGDIKTVWEASRFDWLIAMAERAAAGNNDELDRLNNWLMDWSKQNPVYLGANWKCGQETSIRVMHLALAALILGQAKKPEASLKEQVRNHLARIAPAMSYAIGQANNHGTSEAAALFIGGSWLAAQGDKDAARWQSTGRKWLEDRARVLIENDGTFSQYSVVYHRLVLDTFAFCEVWRRNFGLEPFSDTCLEKLIAATNWLDQMTDPVNGDAPNLGANDGAQVFCLADAGYRDFRPCVQLASVLFKNERAYPAQGIWDQPLKWLNVGDPESARVPLQSETFDDGGLHVLRNGKAVAYLRYPRFRFRPSQADALHCDLWLAHKNIARDAGTYSYLETVSDDFSFAGTSAHNTVEFDGRDQMPRLGRFLYGAWLKATDVTPVMRRDDCVSATAAYRDWKGACHKRQLSLSADRLTCRDEIDGFERRAVLRWRLPQGDWKLENDVVSNGQIKLQVRANVPINRMELVEGLESRHYKKKSPLPVLEVEAGRPATLISEFTF